MKVTSRALTLTEAVKQSKAYLRKHARTLPPAVVAQLKADLAGTSGSWPSSRLTSGL